MLAGCVMLLAAACGGGGTTRREIREALVRSPRTYLHYGRRWWGRPPRLRIRSLDAHGDRATVVLAARGTYHQLVRLHRRRGAWYIAAAGPGLVVGPRAARPASAADRTAIAADAQRRLREPERCAAYQIVVSRLDPRYAYVTYEFLESEPGGPQCRAFNGTSLYRRGRQVWRELSEASSGYPCTFAPPGVIRSLVGSCALPTR